MPTITQKYRRAKLADLTPHPANPRQGDVGAIHTSIEANGWYGALIVQKSTGYVCAGNHRLKALAATGAKDVPILELDIDDATALRILLADNRTSDLATNDDAALAAILREIATPEPAALLGTGYDGDDLDELLRDLNNEARETSDEGPPPLPTGEPDSKPGEIYELGPHRLICGDATDASHAAELMQGAHASLLFTSPPYGSVRDYDKESGINLSPAHLASFIAAYADHADLIAVNIGVLRESNAIVTYWDDYHHAAADAGLKLLAWNVWDRGHAGSIGHAIAMFPIEHEFVFVYGEKRRSVKRTVANKGA